MSRQTVAVVSLAALLSSLLAAHTAAQEARIRDSAGVRIIENSALKDAPVRFRLGDKPLFEVGGIESNPDEEFDHRQGDPRGVRLSDGGLAVIDVSRVHFFDASAKRIRIVGRLGQGPEEFQSLRTICRTRGDTLIVSDSRNRRISVLDGSGRIVRTILRGDNGSAPSSFCFDDGSFVLERSIGEIGSRQKRITRLRTDGSVMNQVELSYSGLDAVTGVSQTVVASGNALHYGYPFMSEIRVYDASGKLHRVIRTADHGDRITDAEAQERLARTIPLNVKGAERTARMERLRVLPRGSSTWPVFTTFEVATDQTIWVQDFRKASRSADAWTAIDSTGRVVGRLEFPTLPERTYSAVQGFGRDYVILRRIDADGARSIAIFPFVRTDVRNR